MVGVAEIPLLVEPRLVEVFIAGILSALLCGVAALLRGVKDRGRGGVDSENDCKSNPLVGGMAFAALDTGQVSKSKVFKLVGGMAG